MFTAVPSGSWVGEGSVIKREYRRYDLIAMRETRVIHVPRPTFMWLWRQALVLDIEGLRGYVSKTGLREAKRTPDR